MTLYNYTLKGVANFSGVENITITGKGRSLTHINYIDISGAFDNSSCITIKKFTISNCGTTIVNTNRSHLTGSGAAIQVTDYFKSMYQILWCTGALVKYKVLRLSTQDQQCK